MQARCPYCSSVFTTDRTGVQFCPSCGKQLNVPAPPPAAGGPETPAQGPGTNGGTTGTVPPPPPAGSSFPAPGTPFGTSSAGAPPPPAPPQPGSAWGAPPPPPQHWGGPSSPGAPAAGFDPQPTDWERRAELGVFAGFFGTLKKSLFSPDPFWRSVRPDGSLWDALSYAWINNAIYALLAMPIAALQMRMSMGDLPRDTPQAEEVARFFAAFMTVQNMAVLGVVLAVLAPVLVLINSAVFHLALLMVGGAKSGFGATVRALSYGSGPWLLSWVPCLNFFAALYGLVLQIWGLVRLHRTDVWRPIVGLLLLSVILGCCFGAVAVAAGMAAAGAASP